MTVDELLEGFSAHAGAPAPTAAERAALLELAAVAAHASERLAAPLACWMAGAGGRAPGELLEALRALVAAAE